MCAQAALKKRSAPEEGANERVPKRGSGSASAGGMLGLALADLDGGSDDDDDEEDEEGDEQ